eukprot:g47592.t1
MTPRCHSCCRSSPRPRGRSAGAWPRRQPTIPTRARRSTGGTTKPRAAIYPLCPALTTTRSVVTSEAAPGWSLAHTDPILAAGLLRIHQWGPVSLHPTLGEHFRGASSLLSVPPTPPPPSPHGPLRSLARSFEGATLFNSSLSAWDVSSVTSFVGTFRGASRFDSDLASWRLGPADLDLSSMFEGARSFNRSLAAWNVSGVVTMQRLFFGASSLRQDLSRWDLSNLAAGSGCRDIADRTRVSLRLGEACNI